MRGNYIHVTMQPNSSPGPKPEMREFAEEYSPTGHVQLVGPTWGPNPATWGFRIINADGSDYGVDLPRAWNHLPDYVWEW